ncbi:hypothetical protein GCM10010116_38300 [Microbispora rosea subsp. aerata]|nr:hypothetical protein GCM10010116_38300 [Microbispora rosea subsp. aerata]GIH54272.1 hypothetical protein Mro02_11860 [Microbispora rosea subsp. aerata]GLJ81549.1 hypothetical protein GCM10017588_02730 [Microbispora rosea subsp. aerata]
MSKPFCALAGVGPYALAKAGEVYEDMAIRGRKIVSRMSREAAQEFEETAHELEGLSRSTRQQAQAQERQEREKETMAQTTGRARAASRA